MPQDPNLESALHPVTALAFLVLDQVYLLAGEGQFLDVFKHQTSALLLSHCIFGSETIHGIICSTKEDAGRIKSAKVLIWGGRSLCLVELSIQESAMGAGLDLQIIHPEIGIDDWIFHACFRPLSINDIRRCAAPYEAVLVTAHNELRGLAVKEGTQNPIKSLGCGSRCLLYSAHIRWLKEDHAKGHVLVAAGTPFGEVYLWSFRYDQNWDFMCSRPCYKFQGHLGSVFGVRISEEVNVLDESTTCMLASCSDDRTIRVWDISNWEVADDIEVSTRCLASTMAHASRIWSVQFWNGQADDLGILSFGEDGIAQAWLLKPRSEAGPPERVVVKEPLELVHHAKYKYHSGKHIWAAAVLDERGNTTLIASGGADGRIASYDTNMQKSIAASRTLPYKTITDQIAKTSEVADEFVEMATRRKAVFDSLEGHWRLFRTLQSSIPSYPSGKLTGRAKIEKRPTTDVDFSDECLYSEEGDFVTDRNLTMKARRQYVYRYKQKVDEMTVWFVKTDIGATVDYLFHCLDFTDEKGRMIDSTSERGKTLLTAKGHHLCINDDYIAEYRFTLEDQIVKDWTIRYTVKGPQKDYVAVAKYSRLLPDEERLHENPPLPNLPKTDGDLLNGKPNVDALKSYAWISNTEFLTTTERGHVLIGTIIADSSAVKSHPNTSMTSWTSVGHKDDLRLSSVITSIPSQGIAFLVGNNGNVFRYQRRSNILEFAMVRQQKPAYLRVQEINSHSAGDIENDTVSWEGVSGLADLSKGRQWISLVSKGLTSDTVIVSVHPFNTHQILDDSLQWSHRLPKAFIVTSSCLIDGAGLVVLGSRNGALLLFDLSSEVGSIVTSSAESMYYSIHGHEAVTDIRTVQGHSSLDEPRTSWILSTGRDGRFAVHSIHLFGEKQGHSKFELKTYHESTLPFGPNIEGSHFDTSNGDLLLWGFRSKEFVVWNESKKTEVMSVECGGAHRYWAFSPLDNGQDGGNFVWTKASICNIHLQTKSSHKVVQDGGHGREIKAVAVTPNRERFDDCSRQLIATGAEDTAIRIFEYSAISDYKCLNITTKHTTGIQKLQWSRNCCQYLFSAAGCEEFFVWEVVPIPTLSIGITCRLSCPSATLDKDLRIMDFCILDSRITDTATVGGVSSTQLVAMVYSDSSLRIFEFCNAPPTGSTLNLLLEGSYTTHCLTQAIFMHFDSESYLCTASTDGHLAFWPLSNALSDHGFRVFKDSSVVHDPGLSSERPTKMLSWQKHFPIHQNSVKCLIHVELSSEEHLIVTGGDDQALAFSHIIFQPLASAACDDNGVMHATLLLPNAHASAVTAVAFLNKYAVDANTIHRFATVGNDQRLKMWEVVDDMQAAGVDRFKVKKISDVHTSVADASALEAFPAQEGEPIRIVVAGIGMETWLMEPLGLVPEKI